MQGAQQKITQDLTGAAGPAGTAAGNEAGKKLTGAFKSALKIGAVAMSAAAAGVGGCAAKSDLRGHPENSL